MEDMRKHFEEIGKEFNKDRFQAVHLFEDAICYPQDQLLELSMIADKLIWENNKEKRKEYLEAYREKRDAIMPLSEVKERIYLWPKGNMPSNTVYTDNSFYAFNHNPDFVPYMYEMLIPECMSPKGAVIVCAGGDHGDCTLTEGFQVCRELNEVGYQCFLVNNRPNHSPWSKQESGADVSRAIRYVRKNAQKYRISDNCVGYAGFSNGGVTGEACIQYYSGEQTVADTFPEYVPDELDQYYGAPDTFMCIYGPRFADESFDYSKVKYPPTFFAVGRDDFAMDNLNATYPDLIAHGVDVEIHTFAGTPHGVGGMRIKGKRYPNFELWVTLADYFMQDVYAKRDQKTDKE